MMIHPFVGRRRNFLVFLLSFMASHNLFLRNFSLSVHDSLISWWTSSSSMTWRRPKTLNKLVLPSPEEVSEVILCAFKGSCIDCMKSLETGCALLPAWLFSISHLLIGSRFASAILSSIPWKVNWKLKKKTEAVRGGKGRDVLWLNNHQET